MFTVDVKQQYNNNQSPLCNFNSSVFYLALSCVFERCKQPECVTSRNVIICNKQFDRFVYQVLIQVWLIDKPLSNLIFSRFLCPFIDISGNDFMYVVPIYTPSNPTW